MIHEVCRDLGIRKNRVEQHSSLWHKVDMRRAIVVPGK